jgi:hypothetical protein
MSDCEKYRDMVADLALDIVTEPERSMVLAHTRRCPSCRAELIKQEEVISSLMTLPPAIEPPVGFESKVLSGVRQHKQSAFRSRRFIVTAAAAAAVFLLFAGFIGGALSHGSNTSVREAALRANGNDVGDVYVHGGADAWVFMDISSPSLNGKVNCVLLGDSGERWNVGSFDVVGGRGYWATKLPSGISSVREAELSTDTGSVFARAILS